MKNQLLQISISSVKSKSFLCSNLSYFVFLIFSQVNFKSKGSKEGFLVKYSICQKSTPLKYVSIQLLESIPSIYPRFGSRRWKNMCPIHIFVLFMSVKKFFASNRLICRHFFRTHLELKFVLMRELGYKGITTMENSAKRIKVINSLIEERMSLVFHCFTHPS